MQAQTTAIDGTCRHLTTPPALTDLQKAQARIKEQHGIICKAEEHTQKVRYLRHLSVSSIHRTWQLGRMMTKHLISLLQLCDTFSPEMGAVNPCRP